MNIIISACLIGVCCRYDGKCKKTEGVEALLSAHNLIPVCPEQLGGLTTPREPAEISNGAVITVSGRDVSLNFKRGAEESLKLAKLFDCTHAILKERSPSCGYGFIYDGSFSGMLKKGDGITAALLSANNISVMGESEMENFFTHGD